MRWPLEKNALARLRAPKKSPFAPPGARPLAHSPGLAAPQVRAPAKRMLQLLAAEAARSGGPSAFNLRNWFWEAKNLHHVQNDGDDGDGADDDEEGGGKRGAGDEHHEDGDDVCHHYCGQSLLFAGPPLVRGILQDTLQETILL